MSGRRPVKKQRAAGRTSSRSLRRSGSTDRKPAVPAKPTSSKAKQTIGSYLIQRLQDYGVSDVFGIPVRRVMTTHPKVAPSV